jgi:hypothetical protein
LLPGARRQLREPSQRASRKTATARPAEGRLLTDVPEPRAQIAASPTTEEDKAPDSPAPRPQPPNPRAASRARPSGSASHWWSWKAQAPPTALLRPFPGAWLPRAERALRWPARVASGALREQFVTPAPQLASISSPAIRCVATETRPRQLPASPNRQPAWWLGTGRQSRLSEAASGTVHHCGAN